MTPSLEIVEVSPRDGLQNEAVHLTTSDKLALIEGAVAAGVRRIEVASFVHPKLVPQMADAEAVCAGLPARADVTWIGLVLNQRGAERALATQVDELGAVAVATDSFGKRNQGQTIAESVAASCAIVDMAKAAGRSAQITISVAFGCPFEGEVDPDSVVQLARACAVSGPREIALADTIGVADPVRVRALVTRVADAIAPIPVRAHFHNTRNTGLANAWAAFEAGAYILDSSIGGIGGCPFAPAATGNIPTEDLVYLTDRAGAASGLELEALIDTATWLSGRMGRVLPGMTSRAGGFPAPETP